MDETLNTAPAPTYHRIVSRWNSTRILWAGEAESLGAAVLAALSSGADLTGADLTDAVLTGADLTGADRRAGLRAVLAAAQLEAELDRIAVALGLANEHEGHVQRASTDALVAEATGLRRIHDGRLDAVLLLGERDAAREERDLARAHAAAADALLEARPSRCEHEVAPGVPCRVPACHTGGGFISCPIHARGDDDDTEHFPLVREYLAARDAAKESR